MLFAQAYSRDGIAAVVGTRAGCECVCFLLAGKGEWEGFLATNAIRRVGVASSPTGVGDCVHGVAVLCTSCAQPMGCAAPGLHTIFVLRCLVFAVSVLTQLFAGGWRWSRLLGPPSVLTPARCSGRSSRSRSKLVVWRLMHSASHKGVVGSCARRPPALAGGASGCRSHLAGAAGVRALSRSFCSRSFFWGSMGTRVAHQAGADMYGLRAAGVCCSAGVAVFSLEDLA